MRFVADPGAYDPHSVPRATDPGHFAEFPPQHTMNSMNLTARVLALADVTPRELTSWRELADRALEPNAFLDPNFLIPSGTHRAEARGARLLVVEDQSRIVLLMSFAIVKMRIRGLPVQAITPRMPLLSEESERWHPLVDPDRPVEALKALLRGIPKLGLPSYLDFDRFPADGPLRDALFAAAKQARVPIVERGREDYAYLYQHSAHPDAASTHPNHFVELSVLSTRARNNLARIEESVGGTLTLVDRGEDPAAIEQFLDLQAAGWKGDVTSGLAYAYRVSGNAAWFTDIADRFRADHRLSVFALQHGSETVYMAVHLHSGGTEFGMQDVFDERFASFRAGSLGRRAVMRRFLSDSLERQLDPDMNPRYAGSTQEYPDRRSFASFLLAPGGAIAKSVVGALPLARRIRDAVKGH